MSAAKRQTRSDALIRDVADALAARPATETQAVAHVESAARVVTQVRSLLEENEGLADEVLRGYEQLNLIFDFTQQIATLTNADEIVDVLLCRLAELLAAKAVYVVGADG